MIAALRKLWNLLSGFVRRKPLTYRVVFCDDLPEQLKDQVLYILGESQYQWAVGFLCPCGCRSIIQLNLLNEARPRWELIRNEDGTYSLKPSIWRKIGCKSHFFFERSQIRWCK